MKNALFYSQEGDDGKPFRVDQPIKESLISMPNHMAKLKLAWFTNRLHGLDGEETVRSRWREKGDLPDNKHGQVSRSSSIVAPNKPLAAKHVVGD